MGLIKAGWRRSTGSKKPSGARGPGAAGRQSTGLKVAVRLVRAFDCSFLSKEDLT